MSRNLQTLQSNVLLVREVESQILELEKRLCESSCFCVDLEARTNAIHSVCDQLETWKQRSNQGFSIHTFNQDLQNEVHRLKHETDKINIEEDAKNLMLEVRRKYGENQFEVNELLKNDPGLSLENLLHERRNEHVDRVIATEKLKWEANEAINMLHESIPKDHSQISNLQIAQIEKASSGAALAFLLQSERMLLDLKSEKVAAKKELAEFVDQICSFESNKQRLEVLFKDLLKTNAALIQAIKERVISNTHVAQELHLLAGKISDDCGLLTQLFTQEKNVAWQYSSVPNVFYGAEPHAVPYSSIATQRWTSCPEQELPFQLIRKNVGITFEKSVECLLPEIFRKIELAAKLNHDVNYAANAFETATANDPFNRRGNKITHIDALNFVQHQKLKQQEEYMPLLESSLMECESVLESLNAQLIHLYSEWELEPAQFLPNVQSMKINGNFLSAYQSEYRSHLTSINQ